ncbi:helix-turn-helix domain-containing protein [Rhodothermus marinus]|uniref:helix-turn-helix domain-containing protein n=1 Tax=Rhodothermus marinus TaxID=29549 RepID=UPI0006D1B3EC|nr:helix-turn-helix domain-containing protein [Rhodothermus marinus]
MRVGLTEEEKIEHALALNLVRRHLSREQRQELVARLRQRGLSLRRIAELLGVDVATIYRDLSIVENATIENPPVVQRADGKRYPARQRTAGLMAGRS